MDYYIKLKNTQIPVTEEIYKAYCQGARKERYFRESDIRNQTFFYDALDTEELNGSDMFSDPAAESVEDAVQKHILHAAPEITVSGDHHLFPMAYITTVSQKKFCEQRKIYCYIDKQKFHTPRQKPFILL